MIPDEDRARPTPCPGPGQNHPGSRRRWRKRYSLRGHPFWVLERDVRRINQRFLDSVIYLYNSGPDAEAGASAGGSGFLVRLPFKTGPGPGHVVAVTNAHVVEGGATVIRLNTRDGGTDVKELTDLDWFCHPSGDDLAVACLTLDIDIYQFYAIEASDFLTRETIQRYDIGPGDLAVAVGRFVTHEGRQRNVPSVRFGSIAQMPGEPVRQERVFGYRDQESFVVEARSIGGYSGSPVVVGMDSDDERCDRLGAEPGTVLSWLLGVSWGHLTEWLPVCDERGQPLPSKHKVGFNSGMMTVVPAWTLAGMLEMPEMQRKLAEFEAEFAARPELPEAVMDLAGTPAPERLTSAEDAEWHEPAEAARRRDETLRRMLNTPPKPQRKP